MLTRAAAAMAVALTIGTAAGVRAQTAAEGAGAPHAMTRAAGMPLRDGALAPGMLTVRVVRGSFDLNAANETVSIEVAGRVESARTGPDGRAQFAHLPIGATVRATAVVDGQALASDRFEMAPESGIRVLLIAGEGAATASGVVADAPMATQPGPRTPVAAADVAQPPADVARPDEAVQLIRVVLAAATAAAASFVVFGRFGWRPGRSRRAPVE